MLNVEFSDEFKQSIAREVVQQLVPILLRELKQNELPHLLTRKQFMELVGIRENKCNELFHRKDFYPLTRDFGHPKVVTHLFFEWLDEQSGRGAAEELGLLHPYRVG